MRKNETENRQLFHKMSEQQIEEEFEEKQVVIAEHQALPLHYLAVWALASLGWLLFWNFLPNDTPEEFWKIVNSTCCYPWYNLTICSFNETCSHYLFSWLNLRQVDHTSLQNCCYWVAQYNSSLYSPGCWKKICLAECLM